MACWFAGDTAQRTAAFALHVHGGYGFMEEYDIQLFYRRAKGWANVVGEPAREYARLADLRYGECTVPMDETLAQVVAKVKKRGINHPYVKNYLLARTTPLTRARKTLPSFEQTFKKLRDNLEDFDVTKVRYDEIQRSAIMMAPAASD